MRKLIALLAAMMLLAAPSMALAGKATTVHEAFGGTLFPFPKDERWNDAGFAKPGCYSGEEGVHWVAQEFTAPGKGTLRVYMEGFTGDHDMYVYTSDEVFLRGDQTQVGTTPAPPEEEIVITLKKGQTITMVACNWLGQPDVLAHYEGTFK